MSRAPFQLTLLNGAHDRSTFSSGSAPLDRYIREQVTQDVRRRVAACFVATTDGKRIAGYYTLASASLLLSELPPSTGKKLPRYPTVPAVRMGRLAVDQDFKAQGLGGAMLADALDRAAGSEIAAYALMVDAKDDVAAKFYRHHGFLGFVTGLCQPDAVRATLVRGTAQKGRVIVGLRATRNEGKVTPLLTLANCAVDLAMQMHYHSSIPPPIRRLHHANRT